MSLRILLRTFDLDDAFAAIAERNGCEPDALNESARAEAATELQRRGWSAQNAARLLARLVVVAAVQPRPTTVHASSDLDAQARAAGPDAVVVYEPRAPRRHLPIAPNDGPGLSREQRRSRRHRAVRARTISIKRMTKHVLDLGARENPERPGIDYVRPAIRGERATGSRPCPFVSCVWNLYLDVSRRTGAIKLNFPDLEPDEMNESCALDCADRGGMTFEEVGAIANITRERIRQIEVKALAKLFAIAHEFGLDDDDIKARVRVRKLALDDDDLSLLAVDDDDDEEGRAA